MAHRDEEKSGYFDVLTFRPENWSASHVAGATLLSSIWSFCSWVCGRHSTNRQTDSVQIDVL